MNNKIEHTFKGFSSTYDVEILIFFNPELKLSPIQDGGGGGQKGPFTSFSPVTFTNVGIRPQNFLTFSFNPFDRLVKNFKFVPSASPKLLNLNQDPLPPQKRLFFWLNPYKTVVMITSLIQMLELPNFGHTTTSII